MGKKRQKEKHFLYLGELGLGTKAYDPLAMDGLAFFLRSNNYTRGIDSLIMLGGLVPRIPDYYTKSASEDMRFIDKDPSKKKIDVSKLKFESEKDRQYFERYVDQKITNVVEAVNAARTELSKLEKVLGKIEVHYQHGEEDRKNMDSLKELKIVDYERSAKNKERLENLISELTEEEKGFKTDSEELRKQKVYLTGKIEELEKKNEPILKYKRKLNKIKRDIHKFEKEIQDSDAKVRQQELKLKAIERERRASGFFRITKRKQISPDEEEEIFRLAKKEYNDELYKAIQWANFHIHTTREKDMNLTGRVSKEGTDFLLVHSLNLRSDNVVLGVLAEEKLENNFKNKLMKLYKQETGGVPDVFLSAHGSGGFRFQPQAKYTENTIEGEERETPEYCVNMKLPTFQSVVKLMNLKQKGLLNWHTKRLEEKRYASGAVIHTIKDNGVHAIEYIDVSELIRLGRINENIKKKKITLKKIKHKSKGKNNDDIERIKEEIKSLEQNAKLKTKTISLAGDYEIGVANIPGRRTNYDFIEAIQRYQKEKGYPDWLVMSEIMHGEVKGFDPNKQYFAPVPKIIENRIEEIKKGKFTPKEKIRKLEKLLKTTIHAIPVPIDDMKVEEVKYRVLPHILDVLKNGGKVVIASGNHYNNPRGGRDEATVLGSLIPKEYKEQVHLLRGIGEPWGSGTIRLDNKKTIYVTHKLKESSDELAGAMWQILKSNKDVDIVAYFDRHHGGGGFADGTAYALGFGNCPWNKYVDMIGKYPSARGLMNLEYDPNKTYFKWELILDPVLENYMGEKKRGIKKRTKEQEKEHSKQDKQGAK